MWGFSFVYVTSRWFLIVDLRKWIFFSFSWWNFMVIRDNFSESCDKVLIFFVSATIAQIVMSRNDSAVNFRSWMLFGTWKKLFQIRSDTQSKCRSDDIFVCETFLEASVCSFGVDELWKFQRCNQFEVHAWSTQTTSKFVTVALKFPRTSSWKPATLLYIHLQI